MKSALTRTPCIGVCSTTSVGDRVCRGCKRYAFEVIRWNGYQDEEKASVLRRIEALTVQIMRDKLHITSEQALKDGMFQLRLPLNAVLSPYCWVNTLLQKAPLERLDLADFGITVSPAYAHLDARGLADLIDRELILLCDAHFDRYYQQVDSFS
ncbi:MAG: DUF1289 domain-containing protein [Pseudomonadales bacterium]|nr:DUF1289 domain-containing protein [Pseudomonadales bacterium]MCP5344806.1 DUF1289 domain-containing protein [Pseudomonadales bacterium]